MFHFVLNHKRKKTTNKKLCFLRKNWLKNIGSPKSRIEKAEFCNENKISVYTFTDFEVRK